MREQGLQFRTPHGVRYAPRKRIPRFLFLQQLSGASVGVAQKSFRGFLLKPFRLRVGAWGTHERESVGREAYRFSVEIVEAPLFVVVAYQLRSHTYALQSNGGVMSAVDGDSYGDLTCRPLGDEWLAKMWLADKFVAFPKELYPLHYSGQLGVITPCILEISFEA